MRNNINKYYETQYSPIVVLGSIMLFAFLNIFVISSFAQNLGLNKILGWISFLSFLIGGLTILKRGFPNQRFRVLYYAIFGIWSIYIIINYNSPYQIINYTTLFGLPFFLSIMARVNWNAVNYFSIGVAINILSCLLIFLFLPGQIFSGWNPNSPIFIVPLILFGLACLAVSENTKSNILLIVFGIIELNLIQQLGNRSSLLAVCLFCLGLFIPRFYRSKRYFLILTISLIVFNVSAPFFQDFIVNSELYKDAIEISSSSIEKRGGLNGREGTWLLATKIIDTHPLLGNNGSRIMGIYFHNFSIDVLIQFGWFGWLLFFSTLLYVLNTSFSKYSKYNIFLWGFASLLLLNTFENAMVDNNYYTIFPYLLIAVPFYINYLNEDKLSNEYVDYE